MTEFSQKCRFYLTESGSNVYQIAKTANLDRTTVQRMITGKRLPSQEFFATFCDHLRINSVERSELMEAYKIEKIGKATYTNRKYIHKLIEHVARVQADEDYYSTIETTHLSTDDIILEVLTDIFKKHSSDEILTNIPPSHNYFYHALTELSLQYKRSIPVKHTFSLYPNPSSLPTPNVNLETIYHMVPFLFSNYKNYMPSYYYSRNLTSDYSTQLFPFYIITSTCVVLLSSNLKKSNVLTDSTSIEMYQKEFSRIQTLAHPFMFKIENPLEAMAYYTEFVKEHGLPTHSIEPQPCIFSLLSSDQTHLLCSDHFPDSEKSENYTLELFHTYANVQDSFKSLCSFDAFQELFKSGQLYGAFTDFAEPLPIEERKKILRLFKLKYSEDSNYYFLNQNFQIPKHIQIKLYNQNHMYIISTKHNHFSFLNFNESSICDAFYDYIDALCEDTDLVYSRDSVAAALNSMTPARTKTSGSLSK